MKKEGEEQETAKKESEDGEDIKKEEKNSKIKRNE